MRSLVLLMLAGTALIAQTPNDLNFLTGQSDGRDLRGMLPRWLQAKAMHQIDLRREVTAKISSAQDLSQRRQYIRDRMTLALGGFPERTPLKARVTAVMDRGDHRVEKIVFESQPGFHVTANLYVPKGGRPPYPAILFPLGHEQGAKAHATWQQLLVTFARKGYVALAWDTLGQGERIQIWDSDSRESKVVRSTTEHTLNGLQCLLVGDALARYTIWDGIRALDYLLSRPEVDANRVGVTGNSGGGTHTAYLGALDDRIKVAAPSCYLTSWKRLLETIGPQDAEQCIPPLLADGLDHADFVLAFAPKPYLMLSAIRDFFPISGARETFAEVQRVYDSLGMADRMSMVEADDGHGFSGPRRAAAYRWFARWLKNEEDNTAESPAPIASEEELWATKSGQVATEFNAESVFTLNQKRFTEVRRAGATVETARQMTGFRRGTQPPAARPYGSVAAARYRMEKLVYESEPGIKIPALLYVPGGAGKSPAVVLAHGGGKSVAHAQAEELAGAGQVVLSVDLRGLGETRTESGRNGSDGPRYVGDFESAMTALLTGKPLVGMRAEDVSRGVDLLAARPEVDPSRISAVGVDLAAVPVLYAAAFDDRIGGVTLERMLISYESVIRGRLHRQQWENAVHGALRHFDLPDLARWLAPRRLQLVEPVDGLGRPVPVAAAKALYPSADIVAGKLPVPIR
ncbi:MAG: acetylxylan esterase [Acidobacteriia bacterium]|nr:acetylxylan esterase [Terriglobia bacterium]